jgi:hypothetical protein
MNSNSQIEKINTFNALVENYDDNLAVKFLHKANWDETVNKNRNKIKIKIKIKNYLIMIR